MNAAVQPKQRKYRHLSEHPKVKAEQEKLDRLKEEQAKVHALVFENNSADQSGFIYDGVRAIKQEDVVERVLNGELETPSEHAQEHEKVFLRHRRRLEDLERAIPMQQERLQLARKRATTEWCQSELMQEVAPFASQIEEALETIESANASIDKVWREHRLLGVDWDSWPELRFPVLDYKTGVVFTSSKMGFWIRRWRAQLKTVAKRYLAEQS